MPLPSSGIISGSQISAEVGTASTNISLRGMGNTASLSTGTGTIAYSDFYGYTLSTYVGSAVQAGTKFICTATLNVTYSFDGASFVPAVGDTISLSGTAIGAGYNRTANSSYVLTNSSGVVTNLYFCIK